MEMHVFYVYMPLPFVYNICNMYVHCGVECLRHGPKSTIYSCTTQIVLM